MALDSKGKTFRHELFPQYKANRAKTPEDLHAQVDQIRSIMDAIKMPSFAQVGMEADDIIATLAKNAERDGVETVMITADKDLLQLVDSNTSALRPPTKGGHEYRLCKDKEVEEIWEFDTLTGAKLHRLDRIAIYPNTHYFHTFYCQKLSPNY